MNCTDFRSCSLMMAVDCMDMQKGILCKCTLYCVHVLYIVYIHFILCTCTLYCVHALYIVYMHFILCTCTLYCVHVLYILYIYFLLYTCTLYCVHVLYIVHMYFIFFMGKYLVLNNKNVWNKQHQNKRI